MVLPDPVDAKILPRKALALEPGLLQQPDRRHIGRDARGFDPVKLQRPECEGNDRIDRRRHVTLPRMGRSHPVAEAARLGATAANVREGETAEKRVVVLTENEESLSQVAALVFR